MNWDHCLESYRRKDKFVCIISSHKWPWWTAIEVHLARCLQNVAGDWKRQISASIWWHSICSAVLLLSLGFIVGLVTYFLVVIAFGLVSRALSWLARACNMWCKDLKSQRSKQWSHMRHSRITQILVQTTLVSLHWPPYPSSCDFCMHGHSGCFCTVGRALTH